MKKVLFVSPYEYEKKGGSNHKFNAQIMAAKKCGYEVWHTAYDIKGKKVYLCNDNDNTKQVLGNSCSKNKIIIQMSFIYWKMHKIFDFVKFDICYVRDAVATPMYIYALKTIKKKDSLCVVEIPTYPSVEENKNSSRKMFYFVVNLFNRIFGRKIHKYVDLFTLIGEKADNYRGIRAINIQNAVDIERTKIKISKKREDGELHLIGVATMSYWHGYDRVIEGLYNYYKTNQEVKIYLHLIGRDSDGSLAKWIALAENYGIKDYLICEGFKGGKELDESFDNADIAIASLGLYRQKLEVVPSIKICEYSARGIPFVYAGYNNWLEGRDDFVLKIPNDDSPVNMNNILDLWKKTRNNEQLNMVIRKYAEENMDWKIWFEKIIEALKA